MVINSTLFVCNGVVGPRAFDVTRRTVRYDAVSATWADVHPMQTGRGDAGFTATDGHIYVIGGHAEDKRVLSSVERYDVVANRWTFVAPLPVSLRRSAVVCYEGQVFLFGGCTSIREIGTNAAFCYDPKSDLWSALPPMPTERYRASACVGSDGWIYVIGTIKHVVKRAVDLFAAT
ncbi:influenza virus NS1A-binding protein homolog A-like [Paramacrobiotus metropolitanus]|uniref:influenza virus NS1A-binding protein homolog A-like n=1 Tax=Paramacrobiotus metropolitanus TaxID=2943436 RepID=UPI00244622D0|nr:influenza virus NS1A-binding protein homolog A-like [Paramacrobiotus metropolitanus]